MDCINVVQIVKTCSSCGESREGRLFPPDSRKPDGLGTHCRVCHRKWSSASTAKRRRRVIEHYKAGEIVCCACCGETEYKFLALDHIDGGGNRHRASIGIKSGATMYAWIENNNFPPLFQILCHNCNMAKGYFGKCPHGGLSQTHNDLRRSTSPERVAWYKERSA